MRVGRHGPSACWFQMTTLILLAGFFGMPASYDGE